MSEESLLDTVLGVSLTRTWLGVTRTCCDAEKVAMLKEDVIQSGAYRLMGLNRKLINTDHSSYKALSRSANRVRHAWVKSTMPWVRPGVRILKKANYDNFKDAHNDAYASFLPLRKVFCEDAWPELVDEAKAKWGDRFNPGDYPLSLPLETFDFQIEYPSLEGDMESLAALDPAAYQKMKALANARLEEACIAAEKAYAAGLQDFIVRLQEALTPEVDSMGEVIKKKVPTKTVNALVKMRDEFKELQVKDHHELNALFDQVVNLVGEVDFKDLKTCNEAAQDFKAALGGLADTIQIVTGQKPPARKITSKKAKQVKEVPSA